jgi:hypothetical protein
VRNGSISGFRTAVDLGAEGGNLVEGLRVLGAAFSNNGIVASGIVKGNIAVDFRGGAGISATGTVTGNYVRDVRGSGIDIGQGSTVIGNTVTAAAAGIVVSCPSNLTDNTAVNNFVTNLVLNGEGCHNEDNLAP